MPAQIEEAVLRAHLGDPQRLGEQRAQEPFPLGRRRAAHRQCGLRSRQGTAVQLAVAGQRDLVDRQDERGHHVRRQERPGVLAQLSGCRIARRHGVAEQSAAVGIRVREHHGAVHGRVPFEDPLDLPGLDPVTADLHLVIRPAQILQRAVGPAPREVPGTVHAGTGRAEGVGDEAARGESGAAQVAPCHPGTCHVDLPGAARRDRPQRLVQQVQPQVGQCGADDTGGLVGVGQLGVGRVHGGLGDPVHVDELRPTGAVPGADAGELQRLTGEHDDPQGGQRARARFRFGPHERVERRGSLAQRGDLLPGEQLQEFPW